MLFMCAFLVLKHAFLEGVHSQYFAARRATQTSKDRNATIFAPKYIKGTFDQTLFKRFNLGKRTSETDSGRRITLRKVLGKFRERH